jgi:ribosomal protein S12 methylthiotransferase
MDRFVGRMADVLVEECIDGEEGLYLGRLACQAPEVDGSAVIRKRGTQEPACAGEPTGFGGGYRADDPLENGVFVRGRIIARAGFDLEVQV